MFAASSASVGTVRCASELPGEKQTQIVWQSVRVGHCNFYDLPGIASRVLDMLLVGYAGEGHGEERQDRYTGFGRA